MRSQPKQQPAQGACFHGSYRPEDVHFLLTPIQLEPTPVAEKERLIQSGQRHYSEMLSRESLPSPRYMTLFEQAWAMNRARMAQGLLDLAAIIANQRADAITLLSLARAGTPVGAVLKHTLTDLFDRPTTHYSLSIIRDRGIDQQALRYVLEQAGHDPASIVFIDGWTGKGVIARELRRAIADFTERRCQCWNEGALDPNLYALTDLAGVGIAPSDADYLIPSSIMNATLSGLVSRSILNEQIGPRDFHGCVYFADFAPQDRSVWFVDALREAIREQIAAGYRPNPNPIDPTPARTRSQRLIAELKSRFAIRDENLIKPGIGEATRVLLRRVPELLILRDAEIPEVAHLRQLADEKTVRCEVDPSLPYQAVALIQACQPS
ncbi:cysteine protease StiP family protein [Lamprobacter modestohalophilus]|uniref:cysteine protease StiP family protein n=1 Tax=Lamprobacter modestohalophilus TaxID=1064514 RepID=UPI002ADED0B8|nr:cysteine protease StiP family protein [Lamprobacter modestohalophilus]MEA1051805.1 cysteine protease StiP family protein [Lamprobacter modestohalophilus]